MARVFAATLLFALITALKAVEVVEDTIFNPEEILTDVHYDKWSRPGNLTSPLEVTVRLYIYFLGAIEAQNLQFTAHALLKYKWKDERLEHNQGLIEGEGPNLLNKIWTPHVYIVNEQSSRVMSSGKDILTTIAEDGTVSYSTRIQSTLLCLMKLRKFPFDYQLCPFVLESWGHNSSEVRLEWEPGVPVTVNKELKLAEYMLADQWIHNNINTYTLPVRYEKMNESFSKFYGNYSSIAVTFRFERAVGHYIMDYYVPSVLLVVVSWVSFWLDPNAVPGRITIGTSTMLTFITLSRNMGSSLPKVSYIKATEIWFIVCTGFIFGSLVEFAFVNTIWRRRTNVELKKVNSRYILRSTLTPQPKRKDLSSMNINVSFIPEEDSTNSSASNIKGKKFNCISTIESLNSVNRDPIPFLHQPTDINDLNKKRSTTQKGFFTMTPQEIAQWIDRRSRLLFPCCFIVFNVLYWFFVYTDF